MPVIQEEFVPVMGFVATQRPAARITVNDVEAELFAVTYRPFGVPVGFLTVGFRVPLPLDPDSLLIATVTDVDGYQDAVVFHPDRDRCLARLQELYERSRNDAYCNFRLANAYSDEDDFNDAYTYYHRCIGLDSGFYLGPFFLGLALYNDDRYDDAILQFRQCGQPWRQRRPAPALIGCHQRRAYLGS